MNRLLIIDADYLIYKASVVTKVLQQCKTDRFIYGEYWDLRRAKKFVEGQLDRLLNTLEANTCELVFGDTVNFRKELYPDYKSNRKEKDPIIPIIKDFLVDEFNGITLPRLEGDDTCRVLYEDPNFYKGFEKVIVSIDKDFYSVPCKFYRDLPNNDKIMDTNTRSAELNLIKQIMMGDKTDGYYGLPGWGEVKVSKYLEEHQNILLGEVMELFKSEGLTSQDYVKNKVCACIIGYKNYNQETHQIKWT